MVLDIILISFTIITLLIASYSDLKTKEVPDWLNYGFLFAVLGIRVIFSLELGWHIFIEGILGFVIFFLLACLLYYSNQWGGGDSKLLMGMGAVLGFSLPFSSSNLTIFWFFLALLFLGSIYGLGWMIFMAFQKRELFIKEFSKNFQRKKLNFLAVIYFLVSLIISLTISLYFLTLLFPLLAYYLLLFVNSVEKSCFIVNYKIEKLTEGDWLAEDVFVDNKKIMEKKTLQREDLHKLSLLKKDKKIDFVKIKEGVPFVPSFLFAYIFVLFGSKVLFFIPL